MSSRSVDLEEVRKKARTPYAKLQSPKDPAVAAADTFHKTSRKPPIFQKKLTTAEKVKEWLETHRRRR